ncbi:MAG: hypothetical protein AAF358_21315 [Pseudomonadota bacterium]
MKRKAVGKTDLMDRNAFVSEANRRFPEFKSQYGESSQELCLVVRAMDRHLKKFNRARAILGKSMIRPSEMEKVKAPVVADPLVAGVEQWPVSMDGEFEVVDDGYSEFDHVFALTVITQT